MNLRQYEQTKFALADIVRSAALHSAKAGAAQDPVVRDIFARLAEDRFNLVVVGRYNRGKTSLMNALMSTRRLPVGVVPLTSVITTVSYGSDELVSIEYHGRSIPERVPIDSLVDYVTADGNAGNVRGVKTAHVQLQAELLRRGFHFVDTPGVGSAVSENTLTTRAFLPEADAVVLVTSFESPLSEDEMEIIRTMRDYRRRMFFVINKKDLVTDDERVRVKAYVYERLRVAGIANPEVFEVTASGSRASGVRELERHLTEYLIEQKHHEFLRVICERVADLLRTIPRSESERAALRAIAKTLGADGAAEDPDALGTDFSTCVLCEKITRAIVDFLSAYQYELLESGAARNALVESGGFCGVHTWQYDVLAGPRGACVALSLVLERMGAEIGAAARTIDGASLADRMEMLTSSMRCPACAIRRRVEEGAVADAARALCNDSDGAPAAFCMPHFQAVLAKADVRSGRRLAESQASAMARAAEDMRRYVLKVDATRRQLLDAQERNAERRGLTMLGGNRGVHGIASGQ